MQRSFFGGLAAAAFVLTGGSAFAGAVLQGQTECPAQQQAQNEQANVLVVRTAIDANGTQLQDGAALIPLHVDLQTGADGQVDVDQAAQQTESELGKCSSVAVAANEGQGAPDAVQQEFDKADQSSQQELLAWRYWQPYGHGGFYGYGYRPYYGYYSHYYPSYGYYYGGLTYPYYYGGYYPYGGYGYSYYYRY